MSDEQIDLGHWIRAEADELLKDMPHVDVLALAAELELKAEVFDGGEAMAHAIASELRRRAEADVRFWPTPRLVKE